MRLPLHRSRHEGGASQRLFTPEELRFTVDCAFQAGREVGFRASQQLAVACREHRTYLIVSDLQRLEQALAIANRTGEAAGVTHAICAIREQFAVPTPQEVAAFEAGVAVAIGRRAAARRR